VLEVNQIILPFPLSPISFRANNNKICANAWQWSFCRNSSRWTYLLQYLAGQEKSDSTDRTSGMWFGLFAVNKVHT
jgi:hypothetical protein